MSRLKELRLHGFKSFADQTRFVFDRGVNAVIGPNGSGKSNMADAIRWVLGEQSNRSLRTRRADDVIFAGSEQRRPQGMAEAVLTLDNADGWLPIDFAEVSIGRRAYRSGESEYLINGARARLRDVVELLGEGRLGANELVVVGQGTVDAALSLRPEERRQLFEEAAGVKGLQVKRNEASSRVARSLDNLSRVSDILGELRPQVRRLAQQAEHQQQHDTLGARARALVTLTHRRREAEARSSLGEARRAAAAAEAALDAFREEQAAGREALAAAEARYWEAEEAARAAGHAREETRAVVIRAESRLEAAEARLAELSRTLEQEEADLAAARAAVGSFDDGSAEAAVSPALAEAVAAEDAWRAAVAALAAADDELLVAEETVATIRGRESDRIAAAARLGEEAARAEARRSQVEQELRAATEEIEQAAAEAQKAAIEAERAATALVDTASAFEAATLERDRAQGEADATRHEVTDLTERLRALRAELDALTEPLNAANRLGRRLASVGWISLLDAIDAPVEAWPAIEAVIGGELEGALLWGDDDPTGQLADARGSARLLARDDGDSEGREQAMRAVGGERTLGDWVGGEVAPRALHRAVVAADVAAMLAGWSALPAGWAVVTVDGDLADARGVVVLRGRAEAPGGAAARAHLRRRELRDAVATLERDLASAQNAAHRGTERLRIARDAQLATREQHEAADRLSRRVRERVEAAAARAARAGDRRAGLEAELRTLSTVAPSATTGTVSVEESGTELERAQAVATEARRRRDELATSRDGARDRWSATRREAEAAEMRMAGRRREQATAEARVAQLEASIPGQRQVLAALVDERSGLVGAVDDARAVDEAARASHTAAEAARAARRAELLDLEREQGGATNRLSELERAAQAAAIEASRRDESMSSLARERELSLAGLPETDAPLPEEEVERLGNEELEAELRRVRRTLSQIGSVNPFAVEEHRELAARLDEMSAQDSDLRSAIAATEELIARLDADITGQFDTAFRAIAERFDEFCRLLFAGGSGSLQMADEADAEAPGGIEIVVRPPGKRLQRLAMLSGGERALTGVALLFAMLTVNPVPFCILDEVDAALDEANIGRFADALRKLSESIDFVVITHNRATIEVADTIYGVTMTDAAVSRVLSLRLADLPAEVTA